MFSMLYKQPTPEMLCDVSIWICQPETNVHNNYHCHPMTNEHIFIFSKSYLISNTSTHRLMSQLALDFDRQSLSINGKKCSDFHRFMKCVSSRVDSSEQFQHAVVMCQQTIMAYIIKELYELFQANNMGNIILDGRESMKIDIQEKPNNDFAIRVQKQLKLASADHPDVIQTSIRVECVSVSKTEDYVSFNVMLQ